ncbi:LacI family DNA-binding transcriptional regulator [Saccharopolyspora cebuensis]|uniref:LacI family DNA-binding transcriptional regulator n=1 Tax=Saccharopolyspora cebuensis TaxID=418759 RepID=A0ABV4CJJ1_9PSEU
MGVTIHDVAARAGVSVATASRALSGQRGVRPENRSKVLAAADALAYQPNAVAAALRSRTTRSLGVVVPRIANPFFATLVEEVEQRLHAADRSLLLANSRYDPELERRQVGALLDRQVDALLMVPCHRVRSAEVLAEAAARVPVVQLDLHVDGPAASWVGVDNAAGISLVVEHLAALGTRRTAFVGAEPTDSAAQARLDGYRRAAPGGADDVLLGDFSKEWGQRAGTRLLDRAELPGAIVCGNDTIALGVLSALAERGVAVPDEVRVTGFDDIPYAALAQPPLTTVRQPQGAIAAEAVRLLTARWDGAEPVSQRTAIAPELVVRASA